MIKNSLKEMRRKARYRFIFQLILNFYKDSVDKIYMLRL